MNYYRVLYENFEKKNFFKPIYYFKYKSQTRRYSNVILILRRRFFLFLSKKKTVSSSISRCGGSLPGLGKPSLVRANLTRRFLTIPIHT